ncbi:MAG: uridine kinase [Lewinellaceae bacterium]|nr:uridine kinase [Lewinellaceae bacterium]
MMKSLIVGISGGSGSGKTTFIRKLRERFSNEELCIISQDDYYRPREEQYCDEEGIRNFDLPHSIDKKAFVKDIKRLIRGEVVHRQEYTFNNEKAIANMLSFEPAPIILVEGIFVFHFKKVRDLLSLKVFLHAKENLKVIRRIKRDQLERNYPIEDVLYRYEHHVLPTFERYIKPYMDEADLVINNNQQFDWGLEVLSGYMHTYLRQLAGLQPGDMEDIGEAFPGAPGMERND